MKNKEEKEQEQTSKDNEKKQEELLLRGGLQLKGCLPPATRKAPAMSAGQSEVRQTEPPWSTDDGRVESLRCSLKAVLSGMVHVLADMNTLAKKLVRDGGSECVTDDIVNAAEFRRRCDVAKGSKVLRRDTQKRRGGDVLAKRRTLPTKGALAHAVVQSTTCCTAVKCLKMDAMEHVAEPADPGSQKKSSCTAVCQPTEVLCAKRRARCQSSGCHRFQR